ncbi:coiled-coil domain-containing protein 174 [Danaus plexippus]|uniref:coiled-coil domain-containing protein 174 n=1 Tax=Danaus plexippus TaxID=13037 RepID=UPI002AB007CD|nr:coiled-coil domain-containing protein 174 [Danaus plexippus]XP_061379843.1 coiled-coil domain-containing protein 174 [Danaus plexippus]
MNGQNSKEIFFDKSILLSLKAELLKKKEEALEKKHLPQHNVQNFKPSISEKKNKSESNKTSLKDKLKVIDTDEFEACRKSKAALEKKAELYEHLADNVGDSKLAGQFLVDFKGKKQETIQHPKQDETEEKEDVFHEEDESEWIEFTDFLGRTRKCLKSDLDYYQRRDQELKKIVTNEPADEKTDTTEQISKEAEKPLLVQKTNDYLQSLREKWEQKERELLAKEKDIHYQDLLFDEARIHGVGYYSFSTDETERKKQMEELIKTRKETLKAQEEAEKLRKERDDMIAARVAAARARQRMRAGLPPEDPEEKKKDFTTCLLQFLTQQKDEADKKAKEEEEKAKKEREVERQKLREAYIREWDVGKEGLQGNVKKFREMSQEEYVEQQRAKRINEFAPPQSSTREKSMYTFNKDGRKIDSDNKTKSWSEVRPMNTPPPPNISDITDDTNKGLYFTTKKPETIVKYKNFIKATEPTAIVNELSDDEEDVQRQSEGNVSCNKAEISPPPTYEYYGPEAKYRKADKPFKSDIREAMEQGARSLETKESNRKIGKQYDFTFD